MGAEVSINIIETIEDKNSLFNIKRFRYGNLRADTILKTIDAKNLRLNDWNYIKQRWKTSEIILETTKEIASSNIDIISKILDEDPLVQNRFFGRISHLSEYPQMVIFTFNLRDSNEISKVEKCSAFFDLYYGYSSFLFVPNIRPSKYIKTRDRKTKRVKIVNTERYINYVDKIYEILNYRNNKPIFVPLSVKFGLGEIEQIIKHYLKKDYYYIWIDFEGSAINSRTLGIIRRIFRILDEKGRFDDTLLYYTNIKREIISNLIDEKTPASDVLASISGANVVGVNREPRRPINEKTYTKEELRLHKARLFERKSYYYVKLTGRELKMSKAEVMELLNNPKYNITVNTSLLYIEILKQCEKFLENYEIKSYVSNKQMFREYPRGKELLSKIFSDRKFRKQQEKILKWF